MRACDLRVGDVVRRLPGERAEWHGDGWRTVRPETISIVGPDQAVWDFDVANDRTTLWEVQVRDEEWGAPPLPWTPLRGPMLVPDPRGGPGATVDR